MTRQRIYLGVAIVLAAFSAFTAFGGLLEAVGYDQQNGDNRGSGIAVLIAFVLLTLVFVRWAVHAEHRLRGNPTVRSARSSTPHPPRVLRATGRGRRQGPVAIAFELLVFGGAFIGFGIGAVVLHGEAQHSSRVQHHGVAETGRVVSIDNIEHTTKTSTYYTAHVAVRFSEPVDGVATTLVHYPHRFRGYEHDPITVLVDPKDTGYAEIAGAPNVSTSSWVGMLVVDAIFGAIGGFSTYELIVVRRRTKAGAFPKGAVAPVAPASPAAPTAYDPDAGLPAPD